MIQKEQLKALISKYQDGQCTEAEIALLESWYLQWNEADRIGLSEDQLERARQRSLTALEPVVGTVQTKRLWPRIIGVAAAVAVIVFGVWFFNGERGVMKQGQDEVAYKNDIAPGKNTATIKIGDGEAITLSDKQTGVIVAANNLTYNDGSKISGRHPESNPEFSSGSGSQGSRGGGPDLRQDDVVVTTPRGGTYQVTLPDGTKVWLNAASSLTYTMPLKERGGIRKVELSGEAYFEVFRNKNQPFVVTTKNLTTTVLGTHFNISAYEDEGSTKATLLEGSVKVSALHSLAPLGRGGVAGEGNVILKPSQQAIVTGSKNIAVKQVDPEMAVAWKNGKFRFENTSLEEVMKQLSRWYDVEIKYQNGIPDRKFTGYIDRNLKASEALDILKFMKVNFKIAGKTIIVSN